MLLAWQHVNVDALNHTARRRWADLGQLSGPELTGPGDTAFRAGDRIVTLAPADRGLVTTSTRGTVTAVDPEARTLTARLDDGRSHTFTPDETDGHRLAHGYAVTVHRCQGATHDTTHLFADGGGRELAYVAMSRARHRATVWTVADDVPQAVDDLTRDWSRERRQRWAIDTGTPITDPHTAETDANVPSHLRSALRQARLALEDQTRRAINPARNAVPDPPTTLGPEVTERLRRSLRDLDRDVVRSHLHAARDEIEVDIGP